MTRLDAILGFRDVQHEQQFGVGNVSAWPVTMGSWAYGGGAGLLVFGASAEAASGQQITLYVDWRDSGGTWHNVGSSPMWADELAGPQVPTHLQMFAAGSFGSQANVTFRMNVSDATIFADSVRLALIEMR